MPSITLNINDKLWKSIQKRATKDLLTPEEEIENIIQRSMVNYTGKSSDTDKVDDPLISIFSRKQSSKSKKSSSLPEDQNNPTPSPEEY
jgi:hypothetical protein